MGVGLQHHTPAALPRGKRRCTYCTGGWVGLRAGLDECGKSRPHRDSMSGPSRPYVGGYGRHRKKADGFMQDSGLWGGNREQWTGDLSVCIKQEKCNHTSMYDEKDYKGSMLDEICRNIVTVTSFKGAVQSKYKGICREGVTWQFIC